MNKEKETQFTLMNLDELEIASSGILIAGSSNSVFSAVCIDSRKAVNSSLFVALKGKSQDGHDFIEDAIKNGASLILIDSNYAVKNSECCTRLSSIYNVSFVAVENTLYALQKIAKFYLNKMNLKLKIGITGSSGKTTVKELIGSIFSTKYDTFISVGNLNSETGLPLSIFMLRPHHEVGVFEMGMNRKGEIRQLSEVLHPNVAIITNIGRAHIGMLGSVEAIAREKKEIFSFFDEDCVAFLPKCEFTFFLREGVKGKVVIFGVDSLKKQIEIKENGLLGSEIKYGDDLVSVPLHGNHNLNNALLALNVGEYFNFSFKKIKQGIENVKVPFGRSELRSGFTTCFFDCYNANPDSMSEAIRFCNSLTIENASKIYILGSMLELGDESIREHIKICEVIFNSDCKVVYLFGNEITTGFRIYAKGKGVSNFAFGKFLGKDVFLYEDDEFESLKDRLKEDIKKGDFVLLKGSRSMSLERLEGVLGL